MNKQSNPVLVSVVMGSKSDWDTMQHCTELFRLFDVCFETKVVSAHRTPDWMFEFASNTQKRGLKIIIAGAGGAAHLPGMIASKTLLPVIGVPIQSHALNGMDSLLSIVQMPAGIPVATVAIGQAGAKNAALLAISILAINDKQLEKRLMTYRKKQTKDILDNLNPAVKE